MNTIEIISPIPGKGLGRTYTAQPEVVDESNYIELGLIVRDPNGNALNNVSVSIMATSPSSTIEKTLTGTGNLTPIYVNGQKIMTPYYPFHYEFKVNGAHTIKFTHDGIEQSVTLQVQNPDPA